MLAIGRALMARPKILLLDEPSMGLAPILVEMIFNTVVEINQQGVTVLLVEQNAVMASQITGVRAGPGSIVLADSAEKLRNDENVQRTYLGIEYFLHRRRDVGWSRGQRMDDIDAIVTPRIDDPTARVAEAPASASANSVLMTSG